MHHRVLASVLLVLAVGVVAVAVDHRPTGPADAVAATDDASVLSDRSGLPLVVAADRIRTADRSRSAASPVRIPALPASTALLLAAALAGFLVLSSAPPHPFTRRAAFVSRRAPPLRPTF